MKLNSQSLAIHRLDSENFSAKDKKLLLDVLKKEYKYEKDDSDT
jgi:hypothetical protein